MRLIVPGNSPSFCLRLSLLLLVLIGLVGKANAQNWTPLNNQAPAPIGTTLLLTDGRILAHSEGGNDYTAWYTLTPDNTGSYINGTWTKVASLPNGYAPLYFASAVLPDGKVTAVGGEYQCPSGRCTDTEQNPGALYDPVANTWTTITPAATNVGDTQSVVLPNGTWMITSCCTYLNNEFPEYFYFNESALNFTEEASSTDGKFDSFNEEGWTLLPNGKVLTVDAYVGAYDASGTNSEVYSSSSNTWASAGSTVTQLWDSCDASGITPSFEVGPAVLMPNGTVFATGATQCAAGNTAIYNTGTGAWTAGPTIPNDASNNQVSINDGPASLEVNGNVIIMASPSNPEYSAPSSFYEWNGSTLTAFPAPPNAANDGSFVGKMLVLPTGQVMFTDLSGDVEILTSSGTYKAAWQPTITSTVPTLVPGQTYSISGTQFNGLSQGGAYGDDAQDATNYPLVRIVNNGTGHVFYARTHGHSTMGVATGSTTVSTNFDVPSGMETGACDLYVVANGIPSAAVACDVNGNTAAILTSPTPNSTLTGNSATFGWSAAAGASGYAVWVGTTGAGSDNLFAGGIHNVTSVTVSGIPANGKTVYVRLWTSDSGTLIYNDYTYTEAATMIQGAITSPAPSSTLTGPNVTFTWNAGGMNASGYALWIGSTGAGSNNLYSTGVHTNTSAAVTGLPTAAGTIYVRLWTSFSGTLVYTDYTYTAATRAAISSPAPSGTLAGPSVTFNWSTATGSPSGYAIWIGSTGAGSNNLYSTGVHTTTSAAVTGLPTNGGTIYVRLWTSYGGTLTSTDYTYTAAKQAAITSPAPNSTLTGANVTFTWLTATGSPSGYAIWIGSSGVGSNNLYSTGVHTNTSASVTGLPTNSAPIYVRLWTSYNGTLVYTDYTYTAE